MDKERGEERGGPQRERGYEEARVSENTQEANEKDEREKDTELIAVSRSGDRMRKETR